MILEVRNKASKAPEDNYTIAACDRCMTRCEPSRLPGRKGIGAANEAERLALVDGWKEKHVQNKGQRGMSWTVELLCPACGLATD